MFPSNRPRLWPRAAQNGNRKTLYTLVVNQGNHCKQYIKIKRSIKNQIKEYCTYIDLVKLPTFNIE